ncbi:MAG: hypothetical protein WCI84_09730 [Bacteroidota bacterium]
MKQFLFCVILVCCSIITRSQTPAQIKLIHFKELQKILPVKPPEGFTREKPKGQTVSSSGISSSSASVEFTAAKKEKQLQTTDDGKQDSVEVDVQWTINVEIIDYAGMGEGMAAAFQMITGMQYENETEDGYEKSTVFNGYKGIEKSRVQESSRSCELQLVVGGRFLVTAGGNGFSDATVLHSLLNSMELKKLESMK